MTERPLPKRLKSGLSWLVLAVCLAWIVRFFARNPAELEVLLEIRPLHAVGLLLLQLGYFALDSLRYQVILEKASGQRIGFLPWLRLFVLGRFLSTLVPQLGNVYRGVQLKAVHGIAYSDYLGSFVAFAWVGTTVNLLLAGITIWLLRPGMRLGGLPAAAAVATSAVTLAAVPVVLDWVARAGWLRQRRLAWVHDRLARVLEVAVRSFADLRYGAAVLGLGLVSVAVSCTSFSLAFLALGAQVGLAAVLVLYAVLQISNYLVVTPGNVGVRELLFGLLGPELGVTVGEAILLSGLLRVAHFIVMVALALPFGGVGLLGDRRLRSRDRGAR